MLRCAAQCARRVGVRAARVFLFHGQASSDYYMPAALRGSLASVATSAMDEVQEMLMDLVKGTLRLRTVSRLQTPAHERHVIERKGCADIRSLFRARVASLRAPSTRHDSTMLTKILGAFSLQVAV